MNYEYDFLNVYNAKRSPGTIHAASSEMAAYFRRYLFQKAISVFELECPETWSKDYFWYVLYGMGFIGVTEISGYGVIPQFCTIEGFNLYYQPKKILIANAAIKNGQNISRTIDEDCVLVKLTPDYCGIIDMIQHYGDLMAMCAEGAGINITNSKLAFIFASDSKNMAESMKKMFDNVQAGQPAQFVDKSLFNENGDPRWITFEQDLKQNFIAPDLIESMDKIERMFESDIGIPNTGGTEKKERLITDEVNANNVSTYSKAELWLESIQDGLKRVREMFGINVSADWRKIKGREVYGSESNTVNTRPVQD